MSNNRFNVTTTGSHTVQNIIGKQQIFPSSNERFEQLEIDNQKFRSQLFDLRDQFEQMLGNVLPGTVDQLLDSRLDQLCNEKGSHALFLMEKQAKRHNLNSTAIATIIRSKGNQNLTNEKIESKFIALQILR